MFWSLDLEENVPKVVRQTKSFHVPQVALDTTTLGESESVQLWVRNRDTDSLLATLNRQIPQVKIDLAFDSHEEISYYTVGSGSVYLTGFYIPQDDEKVTDNAYEVAQKINSIFIASHSPHT